MVETKAVSNGKKLTPEFVRCRLLQEEQIIMERSNSYDSKPELAQIKRTKSLSSPWQDPFSLHWSHKGHSDTECWQNHSHLMPGHKSFVADRSISCDRAKTSLDKDRFDCVFTRERGARCSGSLTIAPLFTCAIKKGWLWNLGIYLRITLKWEVALTYMAAVKEVSFSKLCLWQTNSSHSETYVFGGTLSYNALSVNIVARAGSKIIFENNLSKVIQIKNKWHMDAFETCATSSTQSVSRPTVAMM